MACKAKIGFCAAGVLALLSLPGASAFSQSPKGTDRPPLMTPPEAAQSAAGNAILVDPHAPASQRTAAADGLMRKAGRAGGVRVIAGLRLDWRSPDELPPAEAAAQTTRLRTVQDALVSRVIGSARTAASVRTFDYLPYVALNVNRQQLDRLLADPSVVTVLEDVAVPPTLLESVPRINADDVWADGFPGTGIAVAILDTGVDKRHNMLRGKVVSEACYSTTIGKAIRSVCPGGAAESIAVDSGVNCPAAVGSCDHGTHVAGIAAGNMPSPLLRGVAPKARIIAIQVNSRFNSIYDCFPRNAPCASSFPSDQAKALERVFALRSDFNIAAANLSLGGGQYYTPCDTGNPVASAIKLLRNVGIATTISSGNDGFNGALSSPACVSRAIAVGSTLDTADTLSSFSNHTEMVRLLAPGSNIVSSVPDKTNPRDTTAEKSGTSMAAPHVAGALALLRDVERANVDRVSAALECTGVPVTRAGITERRIDVAAAKAYLLNPPDPLAYFNFNSASQANSWTPLLGTWAISGGRYQLTDITPGWKLSSTDNCYDNMTIQAAIRRTLAAGQFDWAGMFFKSQISDISATYKRFSGYLAVIGGSQSHYIELWRYDQANLANNTGYATLLCHTSIANSVVYGIKVITTGGRHQVLVGDVPYCDVRDYTYGTGRAGVVTKIADPAEGNAFYAEFFVIEKVP